MVKRYCELLSDTVKRLRPSEGEGAASAARELLCCYSGKSPAQLLADTQLYASEELEQRLLQGTERILSGEPLAYVLGEWDFCGMTFSVSRDTLIPRDDTMAVYDLAAESAAELLAANGACRAMDLCTGTGCIGIALAVNFPSLRVTLGDISQPALHVAKENIVRHRVGGRVSAMQLDALRVPAGFVGEYDLIVSNPPYVTDSEMALLEPSVRDYEPELALRGGSDGLVFYRSIAQNYSRVLKPGGYLCFEFGMGQEDGVCGILHKSGFSVEGLRKDERGIIRAVKGRKDSEV